MEPARTTSQMDDGEAVRLVIWDLDNTFWRGTLSEGGVERHLPDNHAAVIELCRRGVMNSICSKNDEREAMAVVSALGVAEYFVFPSISWDAKAPRVARIIENMGLRPASVLFIDDEPRNRAEVAALVPGVQVADETFAASLLSDPRLRGKNDANLTRLAQYKLLEKKSHDFAQAAGDLGDMLRSSEIRVTLEHDVARHIERAVELVQRTNQLNFTKHRLSADPAKAREILLADLGNFRTQAALVRVTDRYGDYGFVGFYMMRPGRHDRVAGAAPYRLTHFCFSCRTLGMSVERWLYGYLGRPELRIAPPVVADLDVGATIDWIAFGDGPAAPRTASAIAPEIRAQGGCEMVALGSYLLSLTPKLSVAGNAPSNGIFSKLRSAVTTMSTLERPRAVVAAIAARLETTADNLAPRLFENAPEGAVLVFNGTGDASTKALRFVHRDSGWEVDFAVEAVSPPEFFATTDGAFAALLTQRRAWLPPDERARVLRLKSYLTDAFELCGDLSRQEVARATAALIERTPRCGKFILMLDAARHRNEAGHVVENPEIEDYAQAMRAVVARYPFAAIVEYRDAIDHEAQILGGANHYDRRVFLRAAQLVADAIRRLPGR